MCLLSIFQFPTQAQNYRAYARRYGMEEGLPHREIHNLIQDRKGFIWAATSGGVVRFDGYRFKIFNHTENGLAGDIVDWVAEDADGYIWACRVGGSPWLNIIDPVSGTVYDAAEFFKDRPLPIPPKRFAWPPHQCADWPIQSRAATCSTIPEWVGVVSMCPCRTVPVLK